MSSGIGQAVSKDILPGIIITGFIFIISVNIPVFGFFSSLIIPIPVLFYRIKLGRKTGAVIPLVSSVVMLGVLGSASFDILYFTGLMGLGFFLGEYMEKNLPIEMTILYPCLIVMGALLTGLIIYANFESTSLKAMITEYVDKNLKMTLVLYENMGMPKESIDAISASFKTIKYFMVRMLPAMAASSLLFISWMTIILARPVFKKKELDFPDFGDLKRWKVPEPLIWCLIGSAIMLFFPVNALKIAGMNCLIILMTVYFFGGIAIISFFFEKKKLPMLLRFFLYSIIALQKIALLVVVGLGIFDMWFNFRKLEITKDEK